LKALSDVLEICTQIDSAQCLNVDQNLPPLRRGLCHVTHFEIIAHQHAYACRVRYCFISFWHSGMGVIL